MASATKRKAAAEAAPPAKKAKATSKPKPPVKENGIPKAKAAPPAKKAKATSKPEPPVKQNGVPKAKAVPPAKKVNAASKPKPPVKENGVPKVEAATTMPAVVKTAPAMTAPTKATATRIKKSKKVLVINKAPTQKLDVYVFGEGSSGELGLGSHNVDGKRPVDVKRPRLNENLAAKTVGVVQIAAGGMHCAALTFDNKILTWGVNDQGALGRDTKWDGGMKEVDDNGSNLSDSDDEDSGMNPKESTPTVVDDKDIPEGTKFVQVVASDSATFALTEDGLVYGWGTFRSNDGVLGFTEKIHIQGTPTKLPELKKITYIAAGSNHALALDSKGNVFAWGSGQQNQLGRRVVERTRLGGLVPREFGLPRNNIERITSGAYHSFAIDRKGQVWTWGLNNFGETGIAEGAGEDNAVVFRPTIVRALKEYNIKEIRGGGHHSLACTDDGHVLIWGRADGSQMGIELTGVPKGDLVFDEHNLPRILSKPTLVPDINAVTVAAGSDNSFAITADGKAYSWGFSANYQTGQGTDKDIVVATLIDNTAVRGKKLNGAGAGGQFSILTAPASDVKMANGI